MATLRDSRYGWHHRAWHWVFLKRRPGWLTSEKRGKTQHRDKVFLEAVWIHSYTWAYFYFPNGFCLGNCDFVQHRFHLIANIWISVCFWVGKSGCMVHRDMLEVIHWCLWPDFPVCCMLHAGSAAAEHSPGRGVLWRIPLVPVCFSFRDLNSQRKVFGH